MNRRELGQSSASKPQPENPNGNWQQRAIQQKLSNLYRALAQSGGCNTKLLHETVRQLLENGNQPSQTVEKPKT